MLGLMLPTWFLSMWISNTAATSMMIPIIQAVVNTLEDVHMQSCMYFGNSNVHVCNTDFTFYLQSKMYTCTHVCTLAIVMNVTII